MQDLQNISQSPIVYQPLKLSKVLKDRSYEAKSFKALEVSTGLEWITPDTDFKESVFKDFIFEQDLSTKCEFLIVVSMYNESADKFTNTMTGIQQNLNQFYEAGVDVNKIMCIVIVDGVKPFMETYKKHKELFDKFFDEEAIRTNTMNSLIVLCKKSALKETLTVWI